MNCLSCGENLEDQHSGIKCSKDHDLCSNCTQAYVEHILSDPDTRIPAKCSLCKVELNSTQVENQMKPEELEIYLRFKKVKEIDPKLGIVMSCPFCKYFEIWEKENTSNYFYCKKDGCKKGSCTICFREFKVGIIL